MDFSYYPQLKKLHYLLVKILLKIPFYLLSSSRNRALLFSIINVIMELGELGACVSNFLADGMESFLAIPWNCMFSVFGLKVIPAVMGLILIMSVLTNDEKIVHIWCIIEIIVLMTNAIMIAINSDELEKLTEIGQCVFSVCFLFKVATLFIVYNYLIDLPTGKFDEIFGFDSGCYFHSPAISSSNQYIRNEITKLQTDIQGSNHRPSAGDVKLNINNGCPGIHKYSLRP